MISRRMPSHRLSPRNSTTWMRGSCRISHGACPDSRDLPAAPRMMRIACVVGTFPPLPPGFRHLKRLFGCQAWNGSSGPVSYRKRSCLFSKQSGGDGPHFQAISATQRWNIGNRQIVLDQGVDAKSILQYTLGVSSVASELRMQCLRRRHHDTQRT